MSTAIEFNNIGKQYRLGKVSSGTIADDLNRWWTMKVLRKEDPFLTIGEANDRNAKGESDYIWALKDISFKVEQGDVVGIIGRNGAGKSTLLKILSKITSPTTGSIRVNGRVGSLLEVGTGFHPDMTGRENIFLNGAILGMKKAEIAKKLDEIIDFSGCERFIDTPVKRYSSGMKMRLGFAVAANLDPEILVVDEVLAVGDMEFRQKAIEKMQELSQGEGRTVFFVSHNLSNVKKLCKTGILLNNGMMDYIGTAEGAVDHYMSYSQATTSETDIPLGIKRKGNGVLRFTDIHLFSKNGTERNVFEVGEECVIRIGFKIAEGMDEGLTSKIAVSFKSEEEKTVAWLSTSVFTDKIDGRSGTVQFRISKLMLNEGIYKILLYAAVDDVEADWVKEATQIETRYQDYFGTGRSPFKDTSTVGHTFLDYAISWGE